MSKNTTPIFGKGSKRRAENIKKVRANWGEIRGFRKGKYK
jgi:hypothetical protein